MRFKSVDILDVSSKALTFAQETFKHALDRESTATSLNNLCSNNYHDDLVSTQHGQTHFRYLQEAMPYSRQPSQSYDIILCLDTIAWCEKPLRQLFTDELSRLLRDTPLKSALREHSATHKPSESESTHRLPLLIISTPLARTHERPLEGLTRLLSPYFNITHCATVRDRILQLISCSMITRYARAQKISLALYHYLYHVLDGTQLLASPLSQTHQQEKLQQEKLQQESQQQELCQQTSSQNNPVQLQQHLTLTDHPSSLPLRVKESLFKTSADKPLADKPLAGKPLAGKPLAGKPLAGKPLAGYLREFLKKTIVVIVHLAKGLRQLLSIDAKTQSGDYVVLMCRKRVR